MPTTNTTALHSLYESDSLSIHWRSTGAACARCEVRIGACPDLAEADRIDAAMRTWLEGTHETFLFDIEHPPGAQEIKVQPPLLVSAAMKLAAARALLKARCSGTCVKAQFLDDHTKFCRDTFLHLYKPQRPFLLTDSEAERAEFLATLVREG